ncbi:hypothetical protein [Aquimarina muelleri]|uniref:Outer membrane protein beta-barrel domain-containing protein n=1 Tax=Aquimarina muelleri TaxID=279356 RepID=A0A918N4R6_9FLAO|nr:hypothetical protein [Aquimarina muelleri]MCX2764560.1 hypothetical protein [Aquimarina muelleri]GGX23074.1 hypothetical protein GCM10007384_25340 [Aquimarina muelleri]
MKRFLFIILLLFITNTSFAQYDPGAINYGLVAGKNFGLEEELSFGARVEYAFNCYTTFMGEYNRSLSFENNKGYKAYNEFAFGVNLILFNWYPTTITAGMGYTGNDSAFFEDIEDKAFLGFRTANFNHGAQIKIRVLYHISKPVHVFAELNVKSLGRRYDTFLIGFSYDFYGR